MNKLRKALIAVFMAVFLVCSALFAVACDKGTSSVPQGPDADVTDPSGSAKPQEPSTEDPDDGHKEPGAKSYRVSVTGDETKGDYTLTPANSGDEYLEGTSVTLTVTPKEGYRATLKVNGNPVELENGSYTFAVTEETEVEVEYVWKYTVSTYVAKGKGEITVASPASGDKYTANEKVAVTATAAEGYVFGSMKVNGKTVEAEDGYYTLTVEKDMYVVVEFLKAYTVSAADIEGATLKVNDVEYTAPVTVVEGATVTVEAVAAEDYVVKGVYVNNALRVPDESGKITLTVNGDVEITVVTAACYTVTVTESGNGGSATLDNIAESYEVGTVLRLTVAVKEYYNVKVTVNGEDVKLINGVYEFTVEGDTEISVVYTAVEFEVTASRSNGLYGDVAIDTAANENGKYVGGTSVSVTVTPRGGYVIADITVNGKSLDLAGVKTYLPYTFEVTVTADTAVYARFDPADQCTVTLNNGEGGTATLYAGQQALTSPAKSYVGQKITVNAVASGNSLIRISVNGSEPIPVLSGIYEFIVEGDTTVTVAYEAADKLTQVFNPSMAEAETAEEVVYQKADANAPDLKVSVEGVLNVGGQEVVLAEVTKDTVYGFNYEDKTYTMRWYKGLVGGILMVEEGDPTENLATIALAAENNTYYYYLTTDATLPEDAVPYAIKDGTLLTLNVEAKTFTLGADLTANLVAAVESEGTMHYLFLAGNVAYDLVLTDEGATLDDALYAKTELIPAEAIPAGVYNVIGDDEVKKVEIKDGILYIDGDAYVVTIGQSEVWDEEGNSTQIDVYLFNRNGNVWTVALYDANSVYAKLDGVKSPILTLSYMDPETYFEETIVFLAESAAETNAKLSKEHFSTEWADDGMGETLTVSEDGTVAIKGKEFRLLAVVPSGESVYAGYAIVDNVFYTFSIEGYVISLNTLDLVTSYNFRMQNIPVADTYIGTWKTPEGAKTEWKGLAVNYTITIVRGEDKAVTITVDDGNEAGAAQATSYEFSGDDLTITYLSGEQSTSVVLSVESFVNGNSEYVARLSVSGDQCSLVKQLQEDESYTFHDKDKIPETIGEQRFALRNDSDHTIDPENVITVTKDGVMTWTGHTVQLIDVVYQNLGYDSYLNFIAVIDGMVRNLSLVNTGAFNNDDITVGNQTFKRIVDADEGFIGTWTDGGENTLVFNGDHTATLNGKTVYITNDETTDGTVSQWILYTYEATYGGDVRYVFTLAEDGTATLVGESSGFECNVNLSKEVKGSITSYAGSVLMQDADGLQLILNLKVTGYTAEQIKELATVSINGKTFKVLKTGVMSENGDIAVHFLLTGEDGNTVADFEDGKYEVILNLGGENKKPSVSADSAKKSIGSKEFGISLDDTALYLDVSTVTAPPEKTHSFAAAELLTVNGNIRLTINMDSKGYSDEELKAVRLVINGKEYEPQGDSNFNTSGNSVLFFFVTDLEGSEAGTAYLLELKLANETIKVETEAGIAGKAQTLNGKKYELGKEGNQFKITVTTLPAITEYTVVVNGVSEEYGSYELTPNSEGNKFTPGADVTLKITTVGNWVVATVKVNGTEIKANDAGEYKLDIAGDSATITVEVAFRDKDEIIYGGEGNSMDSWRVWNEGNAKDVAAKFVHDIEGGGELNISLTFNSVGQSDYGVQLFYNSSKVEQKKEYTVSFTINSDKAITIKFNNQVEEIPAGQDKVISVTRSYEYTGDYNGKSLFSMQFYTTAELGKVNLTLKDIKWEEVTAVYTATSAELTADENDVYLVIKGTSENYDQAALKDLLEGYDFDFQKNGTINNSDWNSVTKETIGAGVATVEENGNWTFKVKITVLEKFAYQFHWNGDFRISQVFEDKTLDFGQKRYTLKNRIGVYQDNAYMFYGLLGIVVSNLSDPSYEATSADLIEENGTVYFVVKGNYKAYDKSELESVLNAVYFNLQNNPNPDGHSLTNPMWGIYYDFNATVSIDESAGTWEIRYDVTVKDGNSVTLKDGENASTVAWGTGAYTAHFGGEKGTAGTDLKVWAEDGTSFTVGDRYVYTLHFKAGSGSEKEFWGCNGLTIVDLRAMSVAIDYNTFKLEMEGDDVILSFEGDCANVAENQLSLDFYDQNGQRTVTPDSIEVKITEGRFTLKAKVTGVALGDYLMHLILNGSNIDVILAEKEGVTFGTQTVGNKLYTLSGKNYAGWAAGRICLTIEESNAPVLTYESAELKEDGDKVYVVLTVSAFENCTEDDIKAGASWRDPARNTTVTTAKVEVVDGKYQLWFDITDVKPDGEYIRANEFKVNGRLTNSPSFDVQKADIVKGKTTYHLERDPYEEAKNLYFQVTKKLTVTFSYGYEEKTKEVEVVYSKDYDLADELKAPVRQGYTFAGWYLNDETKLEEEGGKFTVKNVTEDMTYTAHWTANENKITLTVTGDEEGKAGSVTVEPNDTVTTGNNVTITVKVNDGYRVTVKVGGEIKLNNSTDAEKTITIENVSSDVTIEVTFESNTAPLTNPVTMTVASAGGDVTAEEATAAITSKEGFESYTSGHSVTVSFVVAKAYGVTVSAGDGLTLGDATITAADGGYQYSYTFNMIDGAVTITVTVAKRLTSDRYWAIGSSDLDFAWEWIDLTGIDNDDSRNAGGKVLVRFYDVTTLSDDEIQSKDFSLVEPYLTFEHTGFGGVAWNALDQHIQTKWGGQRPELLKLVLAFELVPTASKAALGYTNSNLYYATTNSRNPSTERGVKIYDYRKTDEPAPNDAQVEVEGGGNIAIARKFGTEGAGGAFKEGSGISYVKLRIWDKDNPSTTGTIYMKKVGNDIYFFKTADETDPAAGVVTAGGYTGAYLFVDPFNAAITKLLGTQPGFENFDIREPEKWVMKTVAVSDGTRYSGNGESGEVTYHLKRYTFDANGGTGDAPVFDANSITYDSATKKYSLTLPQNSFTAPEGQEFKGWKIVVEGITDQDEAIYRPGDTITFSPNYLCKITAQWGAPSAAEPTLSNWAANGFTQEGSSVYFTLTATAQNYTQDIANQLTFEGVDNSYTVEAPIVANYADNTLTLKIEVSALPAKNTAFSHWLVVNLKLNGEKIDDPVCAVTSNEGETIIYNGYLYRMRYTGNKVPYIMVYDPTFTNWQDKGITNEGGALYLTFTVTTSADYGTEVANKIQFVAWDGERSSPATIKAPVTATFANGTLTLKVKISDIPSQNSGYLTRWWKIRFMFGDKWIEPIGATTSGTRSGSLDGYTYDVSRSTSNGAGQTVTFIMITQS